jgi:hypothetical protein
MEGEGGGTLDGRHRGFRIHHVDRNEKRLEQGDLRARGEGASGRVTAVRL